MTFSAPLIVGHRGAPRRARENTLAAFGFAREEGADGVELDVHRTVDGALVVYHDAEIEGFGVLAQHEIAVIQTTFAWMPTLDMVLDECHGMLVNIEIKNSPADADFDPEEALAIAVVDLLHARRDSADNILVSSFHLPSIDRVRTIDPAVPTGYLTGIRVAPVDALEAAILGGHRAVHPFFGLLADQNAVTVIDAAHTVGIKVNTWTVNDPAEILRLATAGVDAIITDIPAEARAALAGRRI